MKPRHIALLAIPVVLYLALAGTFLRAPLRWDETEWPRQADAIARHGVPEVRQGESKLLVHPHSVDGRRYGGSDYGLWHPPLYLYLMSATRGVLGHSDAAARALNLVLGAAAVGAVVFAVRREAQRRGWNRARADRAALIAGTVLATNPFWVSGTMRLDIDGPLLSLLEVLTLIVVVQADNAGRLRFRPAVGAVAGFVLIWAKPPGFGLLMLGLAALFVRSRNWNELWRLIRSSAVAVVSFAASWLLYAWLAGIPWRFPLDFTYLNKRARAAPTPRDVVNIARFNAAWIGWALLAVGVAAVAYRIPRSRRSATPADAFLAVALVSAAYYTFAWTEIGKYTVPVVPLLCVGAAFVIAERAPLDKWASSVRQHPVLTGAAVLASTLFEFVVLGDAVTAPAGARNLGLTLSTGLHDPRLRALALGAVVVSAATVALHRRETWLASLLAAGLLLAVPSQLAEQAHVIAGATQTLVLSPSKDRGFKQTVTWLDRHVSSNTVVLADKDIAYQSKLNRVVPTDRAVNFTGQEVREWIDRGLIEAVATHNDLLGGFQLGTRFTRVARFGDYSIFLRA